LGTFSLYTLNAKSRELKLEQQFDCVGDTDDKFQFISGAKFDANGEIFITDARGRNLKVQSTLDYLTLEKLDFLDIVILYTIFFMIQHVMNILNKPILVLVKRRHLYSEG
jgi:hypothetical protein